HLKLDDQLFDKLPGLAKSIQQDFHPRGAISLTADFRRRGDNWRHLCTVHPEGAGIVFVHFPYPITGITGTIEYEGDDISPGHPPCRLTLKVKGYAGTQPVSLEG